MKYNCLRGTHVQVSELSMGTMTFGGQTDEKESLRIMDYAFDQGINVFDTADVYNAGMSETVTGKGIKNKRDKIILATKVFNPVQAGDGFNEAGLSRRNIIRALDASLKRLDTDYVDIYYLHSPDYFTSMEETLGTMTDLVRAGKIRYIGISNYAAWQIADMLALCEKRGYIAPVITQNVYNAITRNIEPELVPFVKAHNISLTVYNPLAAGLLSGKHKPGAPTENTRFTLNKIYADRYWLDTNFAAVEKLGEIARQNNMSIIQLAFQFVLGRDYIQSLLVGVSRLEQMEQNIAFIEGAPLSAEAYAACDAVRDLLCGKPFMYMR